ncbi:hypothetical protein FGO68_gene6405 [Halteria grandinella]|uniref:Uncharacterized protein n=1 Tax=Halteria grandinella TaxID=5974 RepID=A0A8J8SZN1_HALGN|nr:hypothetical protein FGO68_gene6405 [Halteria grandinella]
MNETIPTSFEPNQPEHSQVHSSAPTPHPPSSSFDNRFGIFRGTLPGRATPQLPRSLSELRYENQVRRQMLSKQQESASGHRLFEIIAHKHTKGEGTEHVSPGRVEGAAEQGKAIGLKQAIANVFQLSPDAKPQTFRDTDSLDCFKKALLHPESSLEPIINLSTASHANDTTLMTTMHQLTPVPEDLHPQEEPDDDNDSCLLDETFLFDGTWLLPPYLNECADDWLFDVKPMTKRKREDLEIFEECEESKSKIRGSIKYQETSERPIFIQNNLETAGKSS